MASEKKIFKCFFFQKFNRLVAIATNQNQRKIHMAGRGLLQKYFSKKFVKISAVKQK